MPEALVIEVKGPSVELRVNVTLREAGSYTLCMHDGARTILDATVTVRNGEATLRTRDGVATNAVVLHDGDRILVAGHAITVTAPREPVRVARAISRQRLDVARIERLLATLEAAVRESRSEDADATFGAVRAAIDRAHATDEFFACAAFSRFVTRITALAASRRESRWVGWLLGTLLRARHVPDARAIDQLVFIPTEALVGNEAALDALRAMVLRTSPPMSQRAERLRVTLDQLLQEVRARAPEIVAR
jgi:hypothetical protein